MGSRRSGRGKRGFGKTTVRGISGSVASFGCAITGLLTWYSRACLANRSTDASERSDVDASRPSAPPPSPLLRASEVLLKYLLKPPTSSSSWDLLPQVLPQVLSWPSASAYRISSAVVMSRGSRVQLVRRAPRDCPPRAKIRAGFFLPQTSFEARSRLSSLVHGVTSRRSCERGPTLDQSISKLRRVPSFPNFFSWPLAH